MGARRGIGKESQERQQGSHFLSFICTTIRNTSSTYLLLFTSEDRQYSILFKLLQCSFWLHVLWTKIADCWKPFFELANRRWPIAAQATTVMHRWSTVSGKIMQTDDPIRPDVSFGIPGSPIWIQQQQRHAFKIRSADSNPLFFQRRRFLVLSASSSSPFFIHSLLFMAIHPHSKARPGQSCNWKCLSIDRQMYTLTSKGFFFFSPMKKLASFYLRNCTSTAPPGLCVEPNNRHSTIWRAKLTFFFSLETILDKNTFLYYMYLCLTVALCDCVHGKGQHQLGQGGISLKEFRASKPTSQHTISWQAVNFALGH